MQAGFISGRLRTARQLNLWKRYAHANLTKHTDIQTMDSVDRPLSPHLQVHRLEITSALSILHRGTGLVLSAGLLLLAYWLMAVASGQAAYAEASVLLGSVWAKIFYTGWCFCFFYHLANGIRHLLWDMLIGLEPEQYRVSGWAVVLFTAVVTATYSLVVIF